jgi:hypothetical protein
LDTPALHAVFDEIKVLGRKIDEAKVTGTAAEPELDLDDYLARTNSLLETLPERIAEAISEALMKQHRLIRRDIESALRDLAARLANPSLPPQQL